MHRALVVFSLFAFVLSLTAQTPVPTGAKAQPETSAAPAATAKDLPVRKVVLYKNGVGYFEHAGAVNGTQRVAIDFTSPQLNDVLQTLTVLDQGGGRIAAVSYNSTTPLAEQLKSLSLGLSDDPGAADLFKALRGQRIEVAGAPGGVIAGRLLSIETRTETVPGADANATIDKYYLTLVVLNGGVRVIELTPTLSVRPLDAGLQQQLDRYLELLSTAHANGLRHLTLEATGQGQRQLRVSYISAVPVWKSTYRMVFPRTPNGMATVQGWAVVDNTVGADWDNVQLSLVAGAPQSFIQPLSQPLYTRRPEIPISVEAETTPQTHEAAEAKRVVSVQSEMVTGDLLAPAGIPRLMRGKAFIPSTRGGGGEEVASLEVGEGSEGVGSGGSLGSGGGVYRPSDAIREGDVSTKAFDEYFEYTLAQPVTIHKNQSAMVPILQQQLPADHVTLWSEKDGMPLRAVWLENKSKLTLDSGSFSVFEGGEFAGEGLLDPIHPGEKRLLSYAMDKAVRVKVASRDTQRRLNHVQIHNGVIVETYMNVASVTYSVSNSADLEREVLIEHPRAGNGWTLEGGVQPAETTPDSYRFKVPVVASSMATLEVREHGPVSTTVTLNADENQSEYLLSLVRRAPDALDELKPVIEAETALAVLNRRIADLQKAEKQAAGDEARVRENLTALKGNEAAKRFVDELNQAEDLLQSTRKQTADLEQQKLAAQEKLNQEISSISRDWDVKTK